MESNNVILNNKHIKQHSVIVRQSSLCQCTERKTAYDWDKLEEKLTPIYIREKNRVSRQQQENCFHKN